MFCLQAQDTVRYLDPWYLFHRYDSLRWTYGTNINQGGGVPARSNTIQEYTLPDGGATVYGIAVTATSFPLEDHVLQYAPSMRIYRQGEPSYPPAMELIDSVTVYQSHRRRYFDYVTTGTNAGSHVVPCFEFYFDTPVAPSSLTDTFYISLYFPIEYSPDWWTGDREWYVRGAIAYTSNPYLWWRPYPFCDEVDTLLSSPNLGGSVPFFGTPGTVTWGFLFPIVGLRCVAPSLRLVERGNGTATVSWTQAEAGVGYELSFGPYGIEPDSGTIVGTTDTSYTLTGLEGGVREAVWVRKACRYDIYDSTVWSEWSLPLVFLTLGVDEVEGEAVRLQVRDGAVAVVGAADGEEVKLYDALGRQVAAARAAAGAETLLAAPAAGVYTVRIGSQSARRVVLTR